MIAKKDAAAKGFTISAQMLQFILGLFIVIVVLVALLLFFFRNQYERVAEQETANLYNRVKQVCETGESQTLDFTLPQGLAFQDYIKKKIGLSTNTLIDPYFYVYYERFPPEPPYEFGGGVLETAESVIAPWSEDLPWSSNLLLTAALDLTSFGTGPGFGKLKEAYLKGKDAILQSDQLKPLVTAGKVINNGQQIVLGNKKLLAGVLVSGTIFCKLATDNSLEACAAYTAVGYFTARVAVKVTKVGLDDLKEFLMAKKVSFKVNALDDFAEKLAQNGEQVTLDTLQEQIEYNGKKIRFLDKIDNQGRGVISQGDHWDALQEFWIKDGQPEKIGAFTFEKDSTTGQLKQILMEKSGIDGPWNKFKQSWNTVKGSVGKILGNDILSPGGMETAANAMEVSVKQDIKPWQEIVKGARKNLVGLDIDPNNKKQVEEFVLKAAGKIRDKSKSGYITLLEKDTKLAEILSKNSDPVPLTKDLLEYFKNDAAKNPDEAKRLVNWMFGKELRIGEKMRVLERGTLGYTILRIQDLYTPLGATYWDKTVSAYNNPVSACGPNQLCLQFGLFVRKYDLQSQCDIKLPRNSVVAPDPRFYLVSPCFSKLDITKKGNTVYVNPHLCRNPPSQYSDNPNYCYATSGYVNYYVTSETSAFFADCIGTGICALVQAAGTAGAASPVSFADIAAKCFGVKFPTGPCGYLGTSLRLIIDLHRESVSSYPYVPDYIMNSFGADPNRYVDC